MLAPLKVPSRVPPATADTDRRPGTRPIQRSAPSTVSPAKPERSSTSPMNTNSGIGMNANKATEANECSAISSSAAGPNKR